MGRASGPGAYPATTVPLIWAHVVLLGAVQITAVLVFFLPIELGLVPGLLGCVVYFLGGTVPGLGLHGPVVRRGSKGSQSIGVLIDAAPDEVLPVLRLLEAREAKATFVIRATLAKQHSELVHAIVRGGHEIVASTESGRTAWPWHSGRWVRAELEGAWGALGRAGVQTRAFVPPRRVLHPAMRRVLLEVGAFVVIPARTWRASTPATRKRLLDGELVEVRGPGHEPRSRRTLPGDRATESNPDVQGGLTAEVVSLLDQARRAALEPRPLSRILQRPVMAETADPERALSTNPVASFYDGLAAAYDREQTWRAAAPARTAEERAVRARLPQLTQGKVRVLEVGAGTGRFTALLGRQENVEELVAVELSPEMLRQLEERVRREALDRVRPRLGDIMAAELELDFRAAFDLVCSFSCFEYVDDLPALVQRLAGMLAPNGRLYFTTAHSGLVRFFVQLGNAVRQGVWLRARTRREVVRALSGAGLKLEALATHGLRCGPLGGVLLEVVARK